MTGRYPANEASPSTVLPKRRSTKDSPSLPIRPAKKRRFGLGKYETRKLGRRYCFCNGAIITEETDIDTFVLWRVGAKAMVTPTTLRKGAGLVVSDQAILDEFASSVERHFNDNFPPHQMTNVTGPMASVIGRYKIPVGYDAKRHLESLGEAAAYGTYKFYPPEPPVDDD
jgi:hypothetical protein